MSRSWSEHARTYMTHSHRESEPGRLRHTIPRANQLTHARSRMARAHTPACLKEEEKRRTIGDYPRQEERKEEEEGEENKGNKTVAVNSPFLEMLLHVSATTTPTPPPPRLKVCASCVNRVKGSRRNERYRIYVESKDSVYLRERRRGD